MGEFENELINDAVDALGSTNQFQLGVRRIVENKVVLIEMRQGHAANAAGHLRHRGQYLSTETFLSRLRVLTHCWHMIHVRLMDHSTHSMFHGPVRKLIISMLFPDSL